MRTEAHSPGTWPPRKKSPALTCHGRQGGAPEQRHTRVTLGLLEDLACFDRYERRALSRRKFAIHQPLTPRSFFGTQNLARPLASLWSAPGLPRLAFAGACFAVGQGCWTAFLVTYLASGLGFSLTAAGLVFAIMMATGVAGRVLLGWVSDRLGSGLLTLRLVAAASASTSLALAATTPAAPFRRSR